MGMRVSVSSFRCREALASLIPFALTCIDHSVSRSLSLHIFNQ